MTSVPSLISVQNASPAFSWFPATRTSSVVPPFTIVFPPMSAATFLTTTVPPPSRERWPSMALAPTPRPFSNVAMPPGPTVIHMYVELWTRPLKVTSDPIVIFRPPAVAFGLDR